MSDQEEDKNTEKSRHEKKNRKRGSQKSDASLEGSESKKNIKQDAFRKSDASLGGSESIKNIKQDASQKSLESLEEFESKTNISEIKEENTNGQSSSSVIKQKSEMQAKASIISTQKSEMQTKTSIVSTQKSEMQTKGSILSTQRSEHNSIKTTDSKSTQFPATTSKINKIKVQPKRSSSSDILEFYNKFTKPELGQWNKTLQQKEAFIYMKIPLDGGYAWLILLAAFLCQLVVDGVVLSVGRMLPAIAETLGLSEGAGALIAALQLSLYYCSGPFSSAFVNKFGFRPVALVGTCTLIVGLLVSSFAADIISLTIFFGIISGLGFGMLYISSNLIVGYYFEKYRAIAMGITSSGTGFGLLIFSPLNNFLIKELGWRNTLRIFSAISALLFLSCFLFKPVKPTKIGKLVEQDDATLSGSIPSIEITTERYSSYLNSTQDISGRIISDGSAGNQIPKRRVSVYRSKQDLTDNIKETYLAYCCCRKKNEQGREIPNPDETQKYIIELNPLDRQDILYAGNPNYNQVENQLENENIAIIPANKMQTKVINYTLSVTRTLNSQQKLSEPSTCCSINPQLKAACDLLFDTKLLKTSECQILLAANFFLILGAQIPVLYVSERAQIPAKYVDFLLSTIGLTNMVIRIISGILAFSFKLNPLLLSGIPVMIGGLATCICCVVPNDIIWFQFLYCVLFGCAVAFSSSLRTIIIVQLLGLQNLTNTFGLAALFMGCAAFIGITVGGQLIDLTGNYEASFMFAGVVIVISGLLQIFTMQILNLIKKYINDKEDKYKKQVHFNN